MAARTFYLDGQSLTPEDLYEIGKGNCQLCLTEPAMLRIRESRRVIDEAITKGKPIYGVSTGFGSFASICIPPTELRQLQVNLIRSHAVGIGEPISLHTVRMMIALRVNGFCNGNSGIRPETVQKILAIFHADCLSRVPCQGTLGASGDLCPLAHLFLGMLGEGKMWSHAKQSWEPASGVLAAAGVEPIDLAAKEGLALINGTTFMCAHITEAFMRAARVLEQALLVAALSIEALKGSSKYFDARIHAARPHAGQVDAAAKLRSYLLPFSEIAEAHKELRVQDAYSIRCTPQVYGAAADTLAFVRGILTTELNSVTDNPLIFPPETVVSGGNFHGEYVAKAADFLAIGIAEVASMSERRLERMTNHALGGLPSFLIKSDKAGVDSGFMIVQYAAASLVSENKVLCHPSSCDSIPSSEGQEDHVSMGGFAARKAVSVVSNVEKAVALELLAACQALEFHRPARTTPCLERLHALVRERVPALEGDRYMGPDIDNCIELIRSGALLEIAPQEARN